ncbi:SDR family oxidoreductase [Pseudonocardia sp. NPDC049154]|uniref:SDR family NAD(P)-dependent oxidoreductase n=1 Tax=Pseudonocardia sp. NPDC049154 TaxID=3155501 RepID=UPI0033FFE2B0
MFDFTDRVVIVTGAANGMGEVTAHSFAAAGATVVMIDRDAERTPLVEEAVRAAGGTATSFVADVQEEGLVQEIVEKVVADHGRIDVVDNNAAAIELGAQETPVGDMSGDFLLATMRGTALPGMLLTRHVLPVMVAQGGGSIVNIASVSGIAGETFMTAYGMAKAAVIQLTRSTAVQYGRHGIRCNAIAPAFVATRNNDLYAPPELRKVYERNVPLGFVAQPRHIADTALFLASDHAAYISGQVIAVDGGLSASAATNADMGM